jgi:hypothetical protein
VSQAREHGRTESQPATQGSLLSASMSLSVALWLSRSVCLSMSIALSFSLSLSLIIIMFCCAVVPFSTHSMPLSQGNSLRRMFLITGHERDRSRHYTERKIERVCVRRKETDRERESEKE